jgi:hypothetical protein
MFLLRTVSRELLRRVGAFDPAEFLREPGVGVFGRLIRHRSLILARREKNKTDDGDCSFHLNLSNADDIRHVI